jgi:hypothetical protein
MLQGLGDELRPGIEPRVKTAHPFIQDEDVVAAAHAARAHALPYSNPLRPVQRR